MKNCLFALCLLISFSSISFGQNQEQYFKVPLSPDIEMPDWAQLMYSDDPNVFEVDQAYYMYSLEHSFEKTVHTQNFKHWRRIITDHVNSEGFIRPLSEMEFSDKMRQWQNVRNTGSRDGQWTSLGPTETYEVGTATPISWHSNVYSIDQSSSNPDILYCGTEGGGVFKTTDHGLNWSLVSANEPFSNGMTAVGIHPHNPESVIVSGNRRLYQTLDGGGTWNEIIFLDDSAYEVKYHPVNSDTIWVASGVGLLRSFDGGTNWETIMADQCWDVDFHPTDPEIMYGLFSVPGENRSAFYRSMNNGENWDLLTNGWYMPEITDEAGENGGKIAVSPADPNRVYACLIGQSKAGDDGWIGVYKSDDQGENWTNPNGQTGGPYSDINSAHWNVAAYSSGYHQGFYNFDFEASHQDADRIWIGTIRLSESSNAGETFMSIGAANSNRLSRIHADLQSIHVQGDEIWVASDGGINFSTDELQSHESRKNGIIGADFWGFGAGWNEDVLVGGKYHNGNSARYQTYPDGVYLNIGGVEESTGYVNPLENRKVYHNQYWAGGVRSQLLPTDLTGAVLELPQVSLIPNENYTESSSSGLYFDPRYSDHIYAGRESKIWKSVDGGASFTQLHNFSETSDNVGEVYEIEISRDNPDALYCVYRDGDGYWDGCIIQKSEDRGLSWQQTTNLPTNRWRLNIATNPQNSAEIWAAATSGGNGEKIYRSTDSGQTWENMTTSILDGQRPKDLFFQGGTSSTVYLATNNGVFVWDENSADWINFSDGLPFITNSLKFAPFYRDGMLRLSTYGRGIWESPLYTSSEPIAQPMTSNSKVYCSRDTVLFDSYSIAAEEGTSWAWEFSPAPQYVSDPTARNLKVVFGEEGSFDVSLTLVTAGGTTATKNEPGMVTVLNYCTPDTIPGQALLLQNDGDWGQTDALGIETNTFTISAWVHPVGIQPDYTGIVMNDGTSAGFNFLPGNNTLGYHWPGGAWWWDSGLDVPADQWSHVAMVASPEGMTVYLNGIAATHETALEPVLLNSMKFGSYQAWGGRNMKGLIDEVCLWNRSLSQEEIRELRHLTKEQAIADDPSFLAYYQFNEPEGRINDKIGQNHASLAGGAERTISSVPVGGGVSQRIVLGASPGIVDFDEVGIALDLSDSGTEGEIVATRISQLPYNYSTIYGDDNLHEEYWVLNHYGDIPGFEFPVFSVTPTVDASGWTLYGLERRDENSDQVQWDLCEIGSDGNLIDNTINFPAGCPTVSYGQFFLQNTIGLDRTDAPIVADLKAFPNPVAKNSQVSISPAPTTATRIRIYGSGGKLVKDFFTKLDGSFQLDGLPAGVYVIQIQSEDTIRTGKIVIQ